MEIRIIFEKDNKSVKYPKHLHRNGFLVYSPRKINIEPATNKKIDTEIFVIFTKKF